MPIGHLLHMLPSNGLNSPVERNDWRGVAHRERKQSRCLGGGPPSTETRKPVTGKRTSSLALHQTQGIQTSTHTHTTAPGPQGVHFLDPDESSDSMPALPHTPRQCLTEVHRECRPSQARPTRCQRRSPRKSSLGSQCICRPGKGRKHQSRQG